MSQKHTPHAHKLTKPYKLRKYGFVFLSITIIPIICYIIKLTSPVLKGMLIGIATKMGEKIGEA